MSCAFSYSKSYDIQTVRVYHNWLCPNTPATFQTPSGSITPRSKGPLSAGQPRPELHLLPACPNFIIPRFFLFCAFSQCTNSVHFSVIFSQGASDLCVISELSKSSLFLIAFCQLFHSPLAQLSHCEGWVPTAVTMESVLIALGEHISAVFSALPSSEESFPVFRQKYCFSYFYGAPVTDLVTPKIVLSSRSPLREITHRHLSLFFPCLPLLTFKYLIFYFISSSLASALQHIS